MIINSPSPALLSLCQTPAPLKIVLISFLRELRRKQKYKLSLHHQATVPTVQCGNRIRELELSRLSCGAVDEQWGEQEWKYLEVLV